MRSDSPASSARAWASSCAYWLVLSPSRACDANMWPVYQAGSRAHGLRRPGGTPRIAINHRAEPAVSVAPLMVTGTDTGVGKTLASAALLHGLRGRGLRA